MNTAGSRPSDTRWNRIKSWGFWIIAAWFLLGPIIYGVHEWVWPKPLNSKSVLHGEWIVYTSDRGHILKTSSCLDVQCVIFADTNIACFKSNRDFFSISVLFPKRYGLGFEQITKQEALAILIGPESRKSVGRIKTKVIPAIGTEDSIYVELSDVETPFNLAMSVPRGAQDLLTVDGVWPIRLDIPLDGFADGFADLLSRCGKGWRLP